ncbi:MAG: periplasmic heavy metal sensor [Pseudomonadota bacterium]
MYEKTTERRSRIMRWALVASLGANLLVGGVIAGAALSDRGYGGSERRGGPPIMGNGAGPLLRALPAEERRSLAHAMRRSARDAGLSRRSVKAELDQLATLLEAAPFDAAALALALEGQGARLSEVRAAAQGYLIERLEALSPEARAEIAAKLRDMAERGGPNGGGSKALPG